MSTMQEIFIPDLFYNEYIIFFNKHHKNYTKTGEMGKEKRKDKEVR